MSRLLLNNKDVQRITGRQSSAAQVLIRKIKKANGKGRYVNISVKEFCAYTGLDETDVREMLS